MNMMRQLFCASLLILLVFPVFAVSTEDCIPGKTPVQCDLKPSPMEFDQCKEGRTLILCSLPQIEQESECPSTHIESPDYERANYYRRVSCFKRDGIKISVYALKEAKISEFNQRADILYNYIYIGESQDAAKLAKAAGFVWANGKIAPFFGMSLSPILEEEFLYSDGKQPVAKVRMKGKWHISVENLNYMGPGSGIPISCMIAFRHSDDKNKLSIAIQTCMFSYNTDDWNAFDSLLDRLN